MTTQNPDKCESCGAPLPPVTAARNYCVACRAADLRAARPELSGAQVNVLAYGEGAAVTLPAWLCERGANSGTWVGERARVAAAVVEALAKRGLTATVDEVDVDEDGTWCLPAARD